MTGRVSWIDWVILVLSVVLIAAAGAWFARRQKSTEQYFVGGRGIPGWAAGLSLFASIISTITFLAYPEQGYGGDWTLLLPGFMLPIVIGFVALVIVPFYRRHVRMSAYEYLEQRFGYPARAYAAGQFLLLNLFRLSFVLFLSAKAIHTFTDWDIRRVILICGVITVLYTVIGGFEAVVWTDVLQSLVMLGGGMLCVVLLLLAPDEGPVRALEIAWSAGKFRLADLSWDLGRPTALVMVSYGLFTYGTLYITNQDSVQRYLATPTTRQANRGLWIGAISCMATWTLFMFLGTLLYSYYVLHPGRLPAEIAADHMKVFPHYVMTHFPRGGVGLVLAAMMAASMSTLSSAMNSMSLVTVCDFVRRAAPGLSDRSQLIYGKLIALMWGVVGTLAALSMIHVEQALRFTFAITAIISGGLLGVFGLAFLVRRANAAGIYAGLAAGALVAASGAVRELGKMGMRIPEWLQALSFPYEPALVIACSNIASFGVGLLICLIVGQPAGAGRLGTTLWDLRSGDANREDLAGREREDGTVPIASEVRE